MPQLPSLPLLNGYEPSWADVSATISKGGAPLLRLEDFKELNTGVAVSIGSSRQGGRKRRRTTGSPDPTASMVLYRSGYQRMIRALKAVSPFVQNRRRVSLVSFDIVFQHTPPISDGDVPEIYEVRVKGARLMDRQLNDAEGDDPNEVSCGLDVMEIVDMIDGEAVIF